MARRKFLPAQERYELVMECRKSGLSDSAWCKERGIPQSTFYNWVLSLRKKGITEIDTVKPEIAIPKEQEVVKLGIIPDSNTANVSVPEIHNNPSAFIPSEISMVSVIEIAFKDTTIKFSNDVRPELLKMTLSILGGAIC